MKTLPKLVAISVLSLLAIGVDAKSNFDIIANLDNGPGNVTVRDKGTDTQSYIY